MCPFFVKHFEKPLKIGFNKFRMISYAVAHGPCCPLGYSVFALEEYCHQGCKLFLVATNIAGNYIALFFRMLFEQSSFKIHWSLSIVCVPSQKSLYSFAKCTDRFLRFLHGYIS